LTDSLVILLKLNYMNLEKNINNMNTNEDPNKKEIKTPQTEIPIPEKQEMENLKINYENLDNLDVESLNEEVAEDINKKIQSGEYLSEADLIEKSALAGDQITQELIQKHLEDVNKYDGKGVFMKLKENKVFKVAAKAVLAYMLFFKGYDAFAGNETEKDDQDILNKMEISDENLGSNNNAEDDKTYQASESDFEENNGSDKESLDSDKTNRNKAEVKDNSEKEDFNIEKASVLDIDQYFEHNKAEINEEGKQEIINHTVNLFKDMMDENGKMDFSKLRDFLEANVKIKASANELQRIGGNAELAEARGVSVKQVIDTNIETIAQSLKDMGLEEDSVDKIIDKLSQAEVEIPESKTGERGVTYITNMENPETGNNYTEEEVKDLKENHQDKYQELLAEARSVKIDLSATSEKYKKLEYLTAELETNIAEEMKVNLRRMVDYQEVLVANDNSPSTIDDNIDMTKKIHQNFNDIVRSSKEHKIEEIKVASFSDELNEVKSFDKEQADEAFEVLYSQESKGRAYERAIDAALEIIEEADPEKSSLLYVNTDEKLQSVSLEKVEELQEKAREKKVDIKFLMKAIRAIDSDGNTLDLEDEYVEIDLNEVHDNVLKSYDETIKKTADSYQRFYGRSYSENKIKRMLSYQMEKHRSINKSLRTMELENGTTLWFQ
jgi:hypothetical protein